MKIGEVEAELIHAYGLFIMRTAFVINNLYQHSAHSMSLHNTRHRDDFSGSNASSLGVCIPTSARTVIIIWHYNPLWVFALSAKSLQVLLSLAVSFQFYIFSFF